MDRYAIVKAASLAGMTSGSPVNSAAGYRFMAGIWRVKFCLAR